MKKLLTTILFLISAALAFAPPTLLAQAPEAVIREITGTVELKKPGTADWVTASPGERIDRATIVSTGFRSSAVLTVGNSTLVVRSITRLSLEDLLSQNETETINISLRTGRVRVEVTPPAGLKSQFTVMMPTSVASVRGTSFEIDTVSIQVLTGAVSYVPVDGPSIRPVTVSAGQESWVDTDIGSAVIPMTAAETSWSLPNLTGQNAGTLSEGGARFTPVENGPGSLVIGVTYENNN